MKPGIKQISRDTAERGPAELKPRERVIRALDFARPDVIPVEYHASPSRLL